MSKLRFLEVSDVFSNTSCFNDELQRIKLHRALTDASVKEQLEKLREVMFELERRAFKNLISCSDDSGLGEKSNETRLFVLFINLTNN